MYSVFLEIPKRKGMVEAWECVLGARDDFVVKIYGSGMIICERGCSLKRQRFMLGTAICLRSQYA